MASFPAVARGSFFEVVSSLALSPFAVHMRSRGGAGDRGVDLVGSWRNVASPLGPIALIGQCKSSAEASVGTASLRDLVAAVRMRAVAATSPYRGATAAASQLPHLSTHARFPVESLTQRAGGDASAGIFFAQAGFTRDAVQLALASGTPLLLAHLSVAFVVPPPLPLPPQIEPPPRGAVDARAPASAGTAGAAAADDLCADTVVDGACDYQICWSGGHPAAAPAPALLSTVAVATLESLMPNRAFLVAFPRVAVAAAAADGREYALQAPLGRTALIRVLLRHRVTPLLRPLPH